MSNASLKGISKNKHTHPLRSTCLSGMRCTRWQTERLPVCVIIEKCASTHHHQKAHRKMIYNSGAGDGSIPRTTISYFQSVSHCSRHRCSVCIVIMTFYDMCTAFHVIHVLFLFFLLCSIWILTVLCCPKSVPVIQEIVLTLLQNMARVGTLICFAMSVWEIRDFFDFDCFFRPKMEEMIKDIREVFISSLKELPWMDAVTKKAAEEKVSETIYIYIF